METTEREALLELAVLGMFADGRIKLAEDACMQQTLAELGWEAESGERDYILSTAINKMRDAMDNDAARMNFLHSLKATLPTAEQRSRAIGILTSILQSDGSVDSAENDLLQQAKAALEL